MQKRALTALLTATMLILVSCGAPEPPPAATETPAELEPGAVRLILVLVADQCTAQYIERFGPLFSGGLEMLVGQAAAQFEWWTGQSAPRDVMHEAARIRLAQIASHS